MDAAKILPGEYATAPDMVIVTVPGSRVGACLRDKTNGIGGMGHVMPPSDGKAPGSPGHAPARYGTYAMELPVDHLLRLGAKHANLEAKVFCGGNVPPGGIVSNIGTRNADFILEYPGTRNIPAAAQDLRCTCPHKVYFPPGTERVLVKKLRESHNDMIVRRGLAYRSRLAHSVPAGHVELAP